jgi:hypothetical protein
LRTPPSQGYIPPLVLSLLTSRLRERTELEILVYRSTMCSSQTRSLVPLQLLCQTVGTTMQNRRLDDV